MAKFYISEHRYYEGTNYKLSSKISTLIQYYEKQGAKFEFYSDGLAADWYDDAERWEFAKVNEFIVEDGQKVYSTSWSADYDGWSEDLGYVVGDEELTKQINGCSNGFFHYYEVDLDSI